MTASDALAATDSPSDGQQQQSNAHHKQRWLVVDFDGTCTERETPSLLPKLAAKLCNDESLNERVEQFHVFEQEYYKLYKEAKERILPETMSLEEALDSLDDVSNIVTEHVSDSGVLKGLDVAPNDIARLIESDEGIQNFLKLQDDCLNVLSRQVANDWQLGILSINWSRPLIHATVVSPLQQLLDDENDLNVPIWCNGIDSNGVVALQVPGALAKRACIAKLQPSNHVVYVGDSSTDLLALIEADLGILIGSCDSAVATAKRWGIQVMPLSQRRDAFVNTCNVIWRAESWIEVDQALKDVLSVQ